jgi:hypothetical protein
VLVGGRPVLSLAPGRGVVRVGLVVPVLERVVDVSVQPAAAETALTAARNAADVPASAAEAELRRALVAAAGSAGSWHPDAALPVLAVLGGVAFPLLGQAYDLGGEALAGVPRWAAPGLACTTIAAAAAALFGDRATRTVRRALVVALGPRDDHRIELGVLAMSLMAAPVLEPDRTARVLAADAAAHPAADLPDPSTLRAGTPVLRRWGQARAEAVLIDAASRPDGLAVLLRTLRYARQLGDHGPSGAMPSRLGELHDLYRSLVPTEVRRTEAAAVDGPGSASAAAHVRRGVAAPRTRPPADVTGPRRARPAAPEPAHRLLAPPAAAGQVRADTPVPLTPAERSLEGVGSGVITLTVPRTVGDLVRWGRLMSNCLGDFGPAVVAGRSTIVGVLRNARLAYAVELTPAGVVRQFCGRANRPPAPADRRVVVRLLAERGLLDSAAPANRPWLADVALPRPDRRTG